MQHFLIQGTLKTGLKDSLQDKMEQWKSIPETNYEVSSQGNIRHKTNKKNLKNYVSNGYHTVSIKVGDKVKRISSHRTVAQAFVENQEEKEFVNHKNGNKVDNRAENLEWCTQEENVHHSLDSGFGKTTTRPIIQYTLEGKEICRYDTIQQVTEEKKYDRSLLIRVCKGRGKTAYGYLWRYADYPDPTEDEPEGKIYLGYENYIVTSDGRVFSKKRKRFLKPVKNANGHVYVTFCRTGEKKRNFYIHTMVANLFLENYEEMPTVVHKNKIKDDNRVENLEWTDFKNQ